MTKFLPVLFVVLLAAVVGGLDFYVLKQKHVGQAFGLAEYMAARQQALGAGSGPFSLAKAMPAQLPGWQVHPFTTEDLALISGRAPTVQESEAFIAARNQENLAMQKTEAVERVDLALYKGETGIRLTGVFLAPDGSVATQALQAQNAFINGLAAAAADTAPRDFVVVDGVQIAELARGATADPALRLFRATLTDAITVTAFTRSTDDEAIAEVLAAVDFVMLNALLADPLANIADSTAAETPQDTAAPAKAANPLSSITQKVSGARVADAGTVSSVTAPETAATAPQKACVRRAGKLVCPKN